MSQSVSAEHTLHRIFFPTSNSIDFVDIDLNYYWRSSVCEIRHYRLIVHFSAAASHTWAISSRKCGRRCELMTENKQIVKPDATNWAGHSKFNWLTSNRSPTLRSIDRLHHHQRTFDCHLLFQFSFRQQYSPSASVRAHFSTNKILCRVGSVVKRRRRKKKLNAKNKQAIWIERWWRTFHNFLSCLSSFYHACTFAVFFFF